MKSILFSLLSVGGFFYCFLVVTQLAVFLYKDGFPDAFSISGDSRWQPSENNSKSEIINIVWDSILLAVFILQHSLMATQIWKSFLSDIGCGVLSRSLYVIATSFVLQEPGEQSEKFITDHVFSILQFLYTCWRMTFGVIQKELLMNNWSALYLESPLWFLDAPDGSVMSSFFWLVHIVSWVLILASTLTMDYAELMGVKQVYYSILNLPPPFELKSAQYQRLFRHFRHPILTSFLLPLWIVPVMRWDRVLLATGLTLYVLFGHRLDILDHQYLQQQREQKQQQLTARYSPSHGR